MDYGENYWAEGTFEDYLAEKEERREVIHGVELDMQQDDPDLTYGSDTAEGL